MAIPTSKSTFKSYCLRALGFGVIDINVSDDQVDDRIDEALQYFAQYHYDGVEKMYLKYQITQDDLDRAASNDTTTATDTVDSNITATFKEGKNFIPMPSSVVSVIQIFPFDDQTTNNMFDIRYQLRLNDLYDFSSTSIIHYQMTMQQLDFLSHILVGEKPLRFNQHQNRLYLKRYATALIKRQWGANLSKFQGVQLLGGVEMNGEAIYSQAQDEINKLEEEIQLAFETPIDYMVG